MKSYQQTKMTEGSKQVRVDNWGIFFLQRLQVFFNKTDYCDLTLQFEGNVQLKVHRLVMNACTEYFHLLEQTCDAVDDVLVMPPDLQADVVLPIVNFMYTGMLEFHMSIFDKLYKTANLMNITVLTKLLDAQKNPIPPLQRPTNKKNHPQVPHIWNLQGKKISAKTSDLPPPLPGRKLPVWKRKSAPSAIPHTITPHLFSESKRSSTIESLVNVDNTPKPTRFEWPDDDLSTLNIFDSTFDDISYTSKPLLTQDDEPKPSTSFDRIRESSNTFRHSTTYDNSTVDIQDVKEYVKEQQIRSNINEEDDDYDMGENDFENNINNKDESLKRKIKFDCPSSKRVRFSISEKENQLKPTKINITPTGKSTSDVDHTKLISEVLKKYPHLVKKNRNIRLKILAKSNNTSTSAALEHVKKPILKKDTLKSYQACNTPTTKVITKTEKNDEDGLWKCQRCSTPSEPVEFVLYYLYRKHMTDVHNEKFDIRMCKFCGHKSTKHAMLMYHQYTKHGIKPPPSLVFPKCTRCPYIASTESLLNKHKLNHTKYEQQCVECKISFINHQALTAHMQITNHVGLAGKISYDCQYCIKIFHSTITLFSHIQTHHRDEARRDGIVSIDENDYTEEEEEETFENQNELTNEEQEEFIGPDLHRVKKEKIKILSDVKLPSLEIQQALADPLALPNVSLEPSSEAEALNNVATGIATSLGLVDVVVLDENQQYILHTEDQQTITSGSAEFILPDLQDPQTYTTSQQVITTEQNVITQSMLHTSDIGSTDELVMVLTDHNYRDGNTAELINNDNSNIVVLYSHPIDGQESQFITSQSNLMLTSQAGLIELRNSNTIVTSSTSHFITSNTENHIESIEMIQREINQHPDIKHQVHLVEEMSEVNTTGITSLTEQIDIFEHSQKSQTEDAINVEHITVLEEIEENENDLNNTLQNLETDPKMKLSDIVENIKSIENAEQNNIEEKAVEAEPTSESEEQNVKSPEINDPGGTAEPFIDETTKPEKEANTEQELFKETNESNKDTLLMETSDIENFEGDVIPKQDCTTEQCIEKINVTKENILPQVSIDSQETTIEKNTISLQMETAESQMIKEDNTLVNKENTVIQEQQNPPLTVEEAEKALKTQEDDNNQMQSESNEVQEDIVQSQNENIQLQDENTNSQIENVSSTIKSVQVQDDNVQLQNENIQTPNENDQSLDENVQSQDENSQLEKVNTELQNDVHCQDENAHNKSENIDNQDENAHNEDENAHKKDTNIHENDKNTHEENKNDEIQDENIHKQDKNDKTQHKNDEEQIENSNTQNENNQAQNKNDQIQIENVTQQNDINQTHDENDQIQIENANTQNENDKALDDNNQTEDVSDQIQDENDSVQDENAHTEDANALTEDESVQTPDENKLQDKPLKQISDTSICIQNSSKQSAKNILADWEDTDSQQSDSKIPSTNVNKLIDDWDDDDEDIKKGEI